MKRFLALAAVLLLLAPVSVRAEAQAITEVVSPGGIKAWLRQDTSVPLIAIEFQFHGTGLVPPEKAGTETMAARMLMEGADIWDAESFRQALADNAIGLSFEAGRDGFHGSMTTLTANRTMAVRLLGAALTEAKFDESSLRQQKARLVAERRRSEAQPNALAYRNWFRLAYEGHPYGQTVRGTAGTAAAIELDDVRTYLDQILTRRNLTIGVAGDISPSELGVLLDDVFGDLPDHEPPAEIPPAPEPPPGLAVIPHPSPQSVVVFGHAGIPREDPDWYPALVVTQILGGSSFSSRLGEEVREKRGLAYGIGAGLASYEAGAVLLGRTATRNDAVAEALSVIEAEWRRLAEEGPTAGELADAKSYLIGSYPISLDSTDAIAAALVDMQIAGLPRDYWSKRAEVISAVDRQAAGRVAKRLLKAEALLTVVVGTPEGLSPTLSAPAVPSPVEGD